MTSTNPNKLITEIRELKSMPNKDQAISLLNQISKEVLFVMQKHSLKVQKVSEFYPSQANLLGLNVNKGMEIKIRLRSHHDRTSFLPLTDLIGTMLHELSHNRHGNHGKQFYEFLDQLWSDYETVSGPRFGTIINGPRIPTVSATLGQGHRLGSSTLSSSSSSCSSTQVSLEREKRLRAAMSRLHRPTGSVNILGSLSTDKERQSSARELAIKAALERRAQSDSKWCGVGSSPDNPILLLDTDTI